jgi:hypothetical protein
MHFDAISHETVLASHFGVAYKGHLYGHAFH